VTDHNDPYELRVTGPAQRQLERLAEGTAAAIVEFMLSALIDNPHRVGGRLQRELNANSPGSTLHDEGRTE